MGSDQNIYHQLSTRECLDLLESHHFGRIALVDDGRPLIFPVNYAVSGETIVFRTDTGTKFAAAVLAPVAFEIDGTDEETQTGWSVVVHGTGREITWDPATHARQMRELDVQPWVPGERVRWVEIVAEEVTGRRIQGRKPFETMYNNW